MTQLMRFTGVLGSSQDAETRPSVSRNGSLEVVAFLGKCPGIARRNAPNQKAISGHQMSHY